MPVMTNGILQVKTIASILGKTTNNQGDQIKIIPGIPSLEEEEEELEEEITIIVMAVVNVSNVKMSDTLLKIVPNYIMLIIIHPVIMAVKINKEYPKKKSISLQKSLKIHFLKTIICIQLVSILKITKIFHAK